MRVYGRKEQKKQKVKGKWHRDGSRSQIGGDGHNQQGIHLKQSRVIKVMQ
jgi:hypothetical protein